MIPDFNGNGVGGEPGDYAVVAGMAQRGQMIHEQRKQAKLLEEMLDEQRRRSSLPKCPSCLHSIEIGASVCAACRSQVTWVGDSQFPMPCMPGTESQVRRQWFRLKEDSLLAREEATSRELAGTERARKSLPIASGATLVLSAVLIPVALAANSGIASERTGAVLFILVACCLSYLFWVLLRKVIGTFL